MRYIFHGSSGRRLRRSIRQHLGSLGSTPEAVAGALTDHGVRGVPGNVYECALARYLQVVVGSEASVYRTAVVYGGVYVCRSERSLPMFVSLPKAMTRFMRSFDDGQYPVLVDTAAREVPKQVSQPA